MFCDKCGQQMDADDKFCPKCGALNSEFGEMKVSEQKVIQRRKKKVSLGYIVGISALVVCIIAGIIFFGIQAFQLKDALDENENRKNKTEVTAKVSNKVDTEKEELSKGVEGKGEKETEEDKVEIKPNTNEQDLAGKSAASENAVINGTQNGTTAATVSGADYILPESDSRYYSQEEINKLSEHDLFVARNEIYARHGRMFDNEELKGYFASKSWYVPQYAAKEFDAFGDTRFNEYEIFNRNAIVEREKQLKGN